MQEVCFLDNAPILRKLSNCTVLTRPPHAKVATIIAYSGSIWKLLLHLAEVDQQT